VDQTGLIAREGVVDSDPEAISVFLKSKAPDAVRIGLETGPTSTWLWTELKRLGLPVVCIDARHAKAVLKMQINKSDRNDAIGIARVPTRRGPRFRWHWWQDGSEWQSGNGSGRRFGA
jgi:transposase